MTASKDALLVRSMPPLEALRGALFLADDRTAAVRTVVTFLERHIGSARVVTKATAEGGALCLPVGAGSAEVIVVDAKDEAGEALARRAVSDLSRALRLLAADAEVAALRRSIGEKESLLRQTTDALFKDAGEIVRVLGELERRDASMKEELHRALRFQRAMIAPLPQDQGAKLGAVYLAADVISADFYDVAVLDPGRFRVFVADATGHGIAAGLATLFVKAEYETRKRTCASPADVLGRMNDTLTSRYESLDVRCTAICMDVDIVARRLAYSCAAHPGPLVARATGAELLPGGGTFIGLKNAVTFPLMGAELSDGELVVAYTDGLIDAANPQNETYGQTRLLALAERARPAPESFGDMVVRDLSTFIGPHIALADDVTAVALALGDI